MALTKASLVDLNSAELILDLDADTSIRANTDDTVDIKIAGNVEVKMTATALAPGASDGNALGTAALEWSDLFLADGALINFGDDQDVTLTHVADTGLLLNSTRQLQFGDSGTYIHQSADGVLDLVSDTEIEINATTIDINGNVEISGTLSAATSITVGNAALTEAELEKLDGITNGTVIASKAIITDANIDITGGRNITISGELDAATGDFSGDVDIDGTANLDVVDIDGATQIDATVTVGVNDTGYDVKFFGATSGSHLLWDESADDLILAGASGLSVAGATDLASLTVDDVAVDGKVITMTGSTDDTFTTTVAANGATSLVTVDTAAAAAHLTITADGTVDINSAGVLTLDSGAAINIEPAAGSAILLDGTISVDAGVVTGATSVTSTAFVGDITGDVTGTADVATVATTVTITDNESTNESNALIFTAGGDVDGGNIGLESDGTLTYNPSTGKVTATGFVGTLTGAVTGNVAGNLTGTVATVTQNSITTMTGLVTTGALGTGSIAAGFGAIDNGTSGITTGGNLVIDVDADANDNTTDSAAGRLAIGASGDLNLFHNTHSYIVNKTGNLKFHTETDDSDIIFSGEDGASGITALTLDMSAAGTAEFNSNIYAGGGYIGLNTGDRIHFTDNTSAIIEVNGGERLTVAASGDVDVETGDLFFSTAGKGIVLGATSNTNANTLHDYEEGYWTPADTNGTAYTTNGQAKYMKIGQTVHIQCDVNQLVNGRTIFGLPFAAPSGIGSGVAIGYHSYGSEVMAYVPGGTSRIDISTADGSAITANNHRFIIGGVYKTDS